MKRILVAIVLATLLTSLTILILFEVQAQKAQMKADSSELIDSKILEQKRKLLVHLPRSYFKNTTKRYPVIYALDATSHDIDVLTASTILNSGGHVSEVIIVGIVNENRDEDLTPHYMQQNISQNGRGDRFLNFLKQEVIPLISQKYRVSDYNMLSGHSRAGLFSFYALLEEPTLFNAYFCYSPSFWRDDNVIVNKIEESFRQKSPDGFLFLSLGSDENDKMRNGFEKAIQKIKQSDSDDLQFHYFYTQHASHSNNSFYSIPRALTIWHETNNYNVNSL